MVVQSVNFDPNQEVTLVEPLHHMNVKSYFRYKDAAIQILESLGGDITIIHFNRCLNMLIVQLDLLNKRDR